MTMKIEHKIYIYFYIHFAFHKKLMVQIKDTLKIM